MRRSKLHIARPDIIAALNNTKAKLFTPEELKNLFSQNKNSWNLPASTKLKDFIDFMLNNTKSSEHILKFPSRNFKRYTWGKQSIYDVAMSLNKNAYFTHRTAMYINDLIDEEPTNIFLNVEQPPNRLADRTLEQERIDMAFSRAVRQTNNFAAFDGKTIFFLNGMNTGNLGVQKVRWRGRAIWTTNIERTLIDIAVRPAYSGGVTEVGRAYRKAREAVSIQKLADTLVSLNFIYPYHQVIGFYLDKAGLYDRREIERFRQFGLKYDFYLTHKMSKTIFSPEWRLHYPADFDL
jgi:predicted transcriptional regulator of viral defense system